MSPDQRDAPPPQMSADARLALIEALERREAGAVRRAARLAWASLAVAGVLLSALVYGAWSELREVRVEVASLETERANLEERTEAQRAALADVEAGLREKQAALSTLIGAVRRTDQRSRSLVGTALDADPRATALVPRAYVHIAEDADRPWARNLGDRLQAGGIIPLGIELVPASKGLRRFEVRYYKQAEEPAARRIVGVLENAGVPATPVYLDLETSTRVRQNHFEIWCPANARRFKLAPLTASAP